MLATLGICKLSLGIIQLSLGISKPLIHPTILGNCIATCKVAYKESKSGPEKREDSERNQKIISDLASEHISEQYVGEPISLCEQLLQGLRRPVVRSKSDFLRTEGSRTPLGRKTPQGN
jgi:hypothetical protein